MSVILGCVPDDPPRVGLTAATLRAIATKSGPVAALEQVSHRLSHPLEWVEGRHRGIAHYPDELALVVPLVGFARAARPVDEAGKEVMKGELCRVVLGLYLDALDQFEAALAETQANLAEHLRPKPKPEAVDEPAPAPAVVAPLPAGGLRDLFTGEARMPVYSDEPHTTRPQQRRLF